MGYEEILELQNQCIDNIKLRPWVPDVIKVVQFSGSQKVSNITYISRWYLVAELHTLPLIEYLWAKMSKWDKNSLK